MHCSENEYLQPASIVNMEDYLRTAKQYSVSTAVYVRHMARAANFLTIR